MRFAVVSDLHANLQAWNVVLQDMACHHVERIICLGDIVGYGPNPAQVLQSVHAHADHLVLGNHDAVIAGKLSADLFNDRARERIEWTRNQLTPKAVEVLAGVPLTLSGDGFRCAHGDFANPGAFDYIFEPQDATASWQAVSEPLLFVGHSHVPGIFVLGTSGTPRHVPPQDFELEPQKRYLVNCGSVGHPRDGDSRACYCIYDTVKNAIFWRRIPFDTIAYSDALTQAELSDECAHFLHTGASLPPVRELINFAPPSRSAEQAQNVIAEQTLEHSLRRRARKWQRLSLTLAAGIMLLLGAAGIGFLALAPRPLAVPEKPFSSQQAVSIGIANRLLPPLPPNMKAEQGVKGWRLVLEEQRKQGIECTPTLHGPGLKFRAEGRELLLRLEAPPVAVATGEKLQIQAWVKQLDDCEGGLCAIIDLERDEENGRDLSRAYATATPNLKRAGGWFLLQKTIDMPSGATFLYPAFEVSIRGELLLAAPKLIRR